MKLRFQLALLVISAIVASLAAAMVFTLRFTKAAMEEDAKAAAVDAADDIARDLASLPPVIDERIQRELDEELRKHRRVTEMELTLTPPSTAPVSPTPDLKPETTKKLPPSIKPHRFPSTPPAPQPTGPHTLTVVAHDSGVRGVDVQREIHGRYVQGRLTVTLSLGVVDSLLTAQTEVTYIVASVAVLLAALITVVLADRIIGRWLARLATAMGEVSEHALDRRVVVRGPPEIQVVSKAFNKMLDRLQEADRAIRSFNERLASEVATATATLSEQNTALGHLNTLLVRTREDLAHKERLAALGQLAAQLAHEIGTPLGSVSGHLQLAMASPECSSQMRDRLAIATQEITRVSRIIRDYLDSTRRIDPDISTVQIERTIREAVEVARGGNSARIAPVSVEVAPDVATWRTDEGVTRQVLVNLVANSLDAVAANRDVEDGQVVVRAQAEDGKAPGRRELVLRVVDNGPGLSPDAVGRLFEPFYTTKGRGKGTGLGLTICRELVQSFGGRIEGSSEPGRGTVFTVRIPNGDELPRRAQQKTGTS